MKEYFPAYYGAFKCIAAACPDSCCRGWDVVIDDETELFYLGVEGELGKKLTKAIYTESDGDRVFHLKEDKRCPFWGEDKLCDIYKALGEESLCRTCAAFPRITMEYADFTEHTLALACPEAARLIISADSAYADFTHKLAEGCEDYSGELMTVLLETRARAAGLLAAEKPLSERLGELEEFAERTQSAIIGEPAERYEGSVKELFESLEYIDLANRELILSAISHKPDLNENDPLLSRVALYFLYRYWLSFIGGVDLTAIARFIRRSVRIIASLAELGDNGVVRAAQLYSKEIEQSYENMERIFDSLSGF